MRVFGARRPGRVDERIVQTLLHLVHNLLLEVRRIVDVLADAVSCLGHD